MSADLHTKYRPTRLNEVFGHEKIVESLRKLVTDQQGRAVTLIGPSGVGKTTLARVVANELGTHPANILEFDAASNSGIDDVKRALQPLMYKALTDNPTRVVIIDECHTLSKSAWQALLKIIEEPPPDVWWMLCTTDGNKVPANIRTRCQVFELGRVHQETILALLEGIVPCEPSITCPREVLVLLASKCDGSPRRALTWLAQCASCTSRAEAAELIRTFADEDDADVIELCRLLVKGTNWSQVSALLGRMGDNLNAEAVRHIVTGYFTKVAMGAKSDYEAYRALTILEAFGTPYPSSHIAPLLVSLGRVLYAPQ